MSHIGYPAAQVCALVVGVDVGGTGIKSVLMTGGGSVLGEERVSTPRPGPDVAARVAAAVSDSVARLRSQAPSPVAGVGLAVPGVVDEDAGIAMFSAQLGWKDAPVGAMVAERVGLPTAFGHDVRAGTLAESRLGAARGLANAVFVPIGTGIAAGLWLDGRCYSASGYAGEIGHANVGHAEPCACGSTGCLEAIASASAIARRYTVRTGRNVGGAAEVLALAARGDRDAGAVWDEALDALAMALGWTAAILAPQAIVIGGGLAQAGDALIVPLARRLDRSLTFQRRPLLVAGTLADRAASIGSALLALDLLARAP